ncbi:MAG: helix-turn-helix domain-containing protein [Betaproteobacteria bacterium]|nr:helix-turn-helix domain-containing protein [Betaproteobacteria bacterium]
MTGNDSLEDSGIDAAGAEAAATPPTAGAILAQAREAAGLSVQDVALQLRLAPRQVTAIERDDFASLPGRTFVRGFVRNYARLLKLDVDAILAALPGDGAAALDRPSLAATTRAIGELPSERAARPGVAKWAIPLVLIAIVAIAALYEFSRPTARARRHHAPARPRPRPHPPPNLRPLRRQRRRRMRSRKARRLRPSRARPRRRCPIQSRQARPPRAALPRPPHRRRHRARRTSSA